MYSLLTKKGIPRNRDAFRLLTFRRPAVTRRVVSPASSFRPLPSSAGASVSVAGAEAVAPALPLPEEACARDGARPAERVGGAERVGSPSARDERLRDG